MALPKSYAVPSAWTRFWVPCKRVPAAGPLRVSCVGGLGGGDGVGGMAAAGAVPFVQSMGA